MTLRQPRVTADEIIKVLRSLGFEKIDQSGSHQKWKHPLTGKQTIVAYHSSSIKPVSQTASSEGQLVS